MTNGNYFEENMGLGVLATADAEGHVNTAIYARPHVDESGLLAFIMTSRRSYENLQHNPHASFLFMEDGPGYRGKRLSLSMVREEDDNQRIQRLRRRVYSAEAEASMAPLHLVFFQVDEERPLVGDV